MDLPQGITIAHYHLHPEGVTRIIDSQVKSLRKNFPDLKIRILCGIADNTERYK